MTIKVVPPRCPLTVPSIDFSPAGELIDRARHATARCIDQGGPLIPNPGWFVSRPDQTHPLPGRQSVNV
jgi:hypothetical protein